MWFSGQQSVLDCHGVFKTTSPLQNINGSCNELWVSYVHHENCRIYFDFSIDEGASVSTLCFYKNVAFFLAQAKYSYFLTILGWKSILVLFLNYSLWLFSFRMSLGHQLYSQCNFIWCWLVLSFREKDNFIRLIKKFYPFQFRSSQPRYSYRIYRDFPDTGLGNTNIFSGNFSLVWTMILDISTEIFTAFLYKWTD